MDPRILRRIEEQLGMPGVVEALSELPPSDLQTLLPELNRIRAEQKTPAAASPTGRRSCCRIARSGC